MPRTSWNTLPMPEKIRNEWILSFHFSCLKTVLRCATVPHSRSSVASRRRFNPGQSYPAPGLPPSFARWLGSAVLYTSAATNFLREDDAPGLLAGSIIHSTLLDRIVRLELSPLSISFSPRIVELQYRCSDSHFGRLEPVLPLRLASATLDLSKSLKF